MTPEQQATWDRIFATTTRRNGKDPAKINAGQRRRRRVFGENPIPCSLSEGKVTHFPGGRCA